MNVIGPAGGTPALTPFGGGGQMGWKNSMVYGSQFSNPVNKGTGTRLPIPSMPIAQVWRYWWAAKSWRVKTDITYSNVHGTVNYNQDSDFVPLGTGIDASSGSPVLIPRGGFTEGWLINGNGDAALAPNLMERLVGNGTAINDGCSNAFFNSSAFPGDGDTQGQTISYLFLQMGQSDLPWSMLFDDLIPGNLFMSMAISTTIIPPVGTPFASTVDTIIQLPSDVKSSVTGSLDGIPFDLYEPSHSALAYTQIGTIEFTTRDT